MKSDDYKEGKPEKPEIILDTYADVLRELRKEFGEPKLDKLEPKDEEDKGEDNE